MSALRQSDLQAALDFLCEAERITGPEPFPTELLDRLRSLVPCEFVVYDEWNQVERRALFFGRCANSRATGGDNPDAADIDAFWRIKDQHPVCSYHARTPPRPHQGQVVLVPVQFHGAQALRFPLASTDTQHQLVVGLPATLRHTKVFLLNSQRRDFDERDRAVLEVLRPHFPALYSAAAARRVATAVAAGGDVAGELVVLSSPGTIDFETDAARELLTRYFPEGHSGRVPEIGRVLATPAGAPLERGRLAAEPG